MPGAQNVAALGLRHAPRLRRGPKTTTISLWVVSNCRTNSSLFGLKWLGVAHVQGMYETRQRITLQADHSLCTRETPTPTTMASKMDFLADPAIVRQNPFQSTKICPHVSSETKGRTPHPIKNPANEHASV